MWDGALEPFKQVITTIIQDIFVTSANYKHPRYILNFAFVWSVFYYFCNLLIYTCCLFINRYLFVHRFAWNIIITISRPFCFCKTFKILMSRSTQSLWFNVVLDIPIWLNLTHAKDMVYEIASNKKRKQFHIPSLHLNEIALDSVSHLKRSYI